MVGPQMVIFACAHEESKMLQIRFCSGPPTELSSCHRFRVRRARFKYVLDLFVSQPQRSDHVVDWEPSPHSKIRPNLRDALEDNLTALL